MYFCFQGISYRQLNALILTDSYYSKVRCQQLQLDNKGN